MRNPAETANSLYSTAIKAGFLAASPPPPDQLYYNNICNHRKTLERFSAVFGEEAIIPRIFDRADFKGGSLMEDFFEAIGIPGATILIPRRIQMKACHILVLRFSVDLTKKSRAGFPVKQIPCAAILSGILRPIMGLVAMMNMLCPGGFIGNMMTRFQNPMSG